jgi:hypothetical protein
MKDGMKRCPIAFLSRLASWKNDTRRKGLKKSVNLSGLKKSWGRME